MGGFGLEKTTRTRYNEFKYKEPASQHTTTRSASPYNTNPGSPAVTLQYYSPDFDGRMVVPLPQRQYDTDEIADRITTYLDDERKTVECIRIYTEDLLENDTTERIQQTLDGPCPVHADDEPAGIIYGEPQDDRVLAADETISDQTLPDY